MTDEELYRGILSGDPLGNMTFGQAVATDPRRIEGLLLQRVIQPLVLALTKVENPNLNTNAIQEAMEHAYLERNHRLRKRGNGHVTAEGLVHANKQAWKMNGRVLKAVFQTPTPEGNVLKGLLAANQQDIRRAFRESKTICERAVTECVNEQCVDAWKQMTAIIENMGDMIERYLTSSLVGETIDDQWAQIVPPLELEAKMPPKQEDLFGALSFDEAMGAYEFEEYVVTGHRAPAVGLAQYRRSGGRYYGGTN